MGTGMQGQRSLNPGQEVTHFSRRGEDKQFKVIERTLDLLVEFHRATLRQTVGLVAVAAVHALGPGCYVLEISLALPTPGTTQQTNNKQCMSTAKQKQKRTYNTWTVVCRSLPQTRRKPQRAHPAALCGCGKTQTWLGIYPTCDAGQGQSPPTMGGHKEKQQALYIALEKATLNTQ